MRGHHIYTRSWFEYGSKSKNAGTFTVELTNGIFGDKTDDVIYNRLNPMCAAVPEALAPRNSEQSLLRLYHIPPDASVVSRSWFVTDEITERGTVPYSYSLIFKGERDNDIFLQNPEKAFAKDSFERYENFRARVGPDAPSAVSAKYDPRGDDYTQPFKFTKDDWIGTFGFDRELFILFYSSLCKAVCSKSGAKVGAILPLNRDGETFILAVLSVLPMFLKRKFGAAANWAGMMDGNSSNAVNGLHLLCYFDESPISDSKFPVIDLTPAKRHENVDAKISEYAGWVWDNLDDAGLLAGFEGFLGENFPAVLDKMPYDVIENCFSLWSTFIAGNGELGYSQAAHLIKETADNFAKNFTKFPLISEYIRKCMTVLRSGLSGGSQGALTVPVIQAICLLAANGEEISKGFAFDIYTFFTAQNDLKKSGAVLPYCAGLLENPNITPDFEERICGMMAAALKCDDANSVKTAQEAIYKYCCRKRAAVLADRADQRKALSDYREMAAALYLSMNGKLTGEIFKTPAPDSPGLSCAESFCELMEFDIKSLGFVPDPEHWGISADWVKNLPEERRSALFVLYYSKVADKRRCFLYLEREMPELLLALMKDGDVLDEIKNVYTDMFDSEWREGDRSPKNDQTWADLLKWKERLDKLGFPPDDAVFENIRGSVNLRKDILVQISGKISRASLSAIYKLYKSDFRIMSLACLLNLIDNAANGELNEEKQRDILKGYPERDLIFRDAKYRMEFWYDKYRNETVLWALEMTRAVMMNNEFDVDAFLSLCRPKHENPSGTQDVLDILKAMKMWNGLENSAYRPINSAFQSFFEEKYLYGAGYSTVENIFTKKDVIAAFKNLRMPEWKRPTGKKIADILKQNKRIDSDIIQEYYYSPRIDDGPALPAEFMLIVTGSVFVLYALSFLFIFVLGTGTGASFVTNILPYIFGVLILGSSVYNTFINIKK